MALLQSNFAKINVFVARFARPLSQFQPNASPENVSEKEKLVKKSVFISQSNDVYTNLAFENWLVKNFDFSKHHVLFLHKNNPSVVIGNNQNPWVETNVSGLYHNGESKIQLARRFNNGSAVYNDLGNLNMTFFTPTEHHSVQRNMEIVSRALFRKYSLKLNYSPKKNLMVYNKMITVNGFQKNETNAYHNCSLLVNVNKVDLFDALYKKEADSKIDNALKPKKSNFMNVQEVSPKAKIVDVMSAVGWEYLRSRAFTLKDGGMELAQQQKGFQMINPTEKWFPGLSEIRSNLQSWDWCYGKTPKFSISRSFPVPSRLLENYEGTCPDLYITLKVENGLITDVTLFVPPGLTRSGFSGEAKVITSLRGCRFSEDALNSLESHIRDGEQSYADDGDKFVSECVRQMTFN